MAGSTFSRTWPSSAPTPRFPSCLPRSRCGAKDIPFLPIFWLFAGFILFCGTGHLIEATIFWHPWYRLSGVVKMITALSSWGTVFALIRVTPRALALPGLARVNQKLQEEIQSRQAAQEQLQQARDQLELRVYERTTQLEAANQDLQKEITERKLAGEQFRSVLESARMRWSS